MDCTILPRTGAVGGWWLITAILSAGAAAQPVVYDSAKYVVNELALNSGTSVALDGSTIVVGVPGNVEQSYFPGTAVLFDAETDEQGLTLAAADSDSLDLFGQSVAIAGGIVVVGAPLADGVGADSGAAYIFDRATGQLLHKLLPNDSNAGDNFGRAVATDGSIVLVGSPLARQGGLWTGAVYAFNAATGQQIRKIVGSDSGHGDRFGYSLAMDSAYVIAGAPQALTTTSTGAAYVFDASTGQQLSKLVALDGGYSDNIGWSVAVAGDIAVVGAPQSGDSGAAYFFDIPSHSQIAKTTSPHAETDGQYGYSVAASGTGAVVGAPFEHALNGSELSGPTYVYSLLQGVLVAELRQSDPPDINGIDKMSMSLAMQGERVIAGAPATWAGQNPYQGAARRFQLAPLVVGIYGSRVVEDGAAPVVLTVDANRVGEYQWRKDGVELTDGALYSGVHTDTLTVSPTFDSEGEYDVVVANAFGSAVSPIAALGIRGGGCLADADHNGVVDTRDVIAFLNAWNTGCP